MLKKISNRVVTPSVLVLISFIFIFVAFVSKLDYAHVFTDEILYMNLGREYLRGLYETSIQVFPLPKVLAGAMYKISNRNVSLLRLPYALMGVISAYMMYLIAKREYGRKYGILAALLFTASPIIFNATRMIMLEPLTNLFWLLFHFFYYRGIKDNRIVYFIIAGIFIGLSISTKVTSALLIPFILITLPFALIRHKTHTPKVFLNYLVMFALAIPPFLGTHFLYLQKMGVIYGLRKVYDAIFDVYISKSVEGKLHLINNKLYLKSPSWTYFFYLYKQHGIIKISVYVITSLIALAKKNMFTLYWGAFLLISFSFHQLSGIKNERYISSFEFPLIMLVTAGVFYLLQHLNKKGVTSNKTIYILLLIVFVHSFVFVLNLKPTKYNGLFRYLSSASSDFRANNKYYVYGSLRTIRWYKHGKGEGFKIGRNFRVECPNITKYQFAIFDIEQLKRTQDDMLPLFVEQNKANHDFMEKFGFYILSRNSASPEFICPSIN